ncbi:MAG: hypothetical protein WC610_00465 [Patescibacteria group bacterium]
MAAGGKDRLDRLDRAVGKSFKLIWGKLQRLDRWGERQWREYRNFWIRNIWHGGSKQLTKPRTGNRFWDFLQGRFYDLCRFLDWLDTISYFRGRIYQAKACRVRSKAEKKIANYFTDHGVKFQYEKRLYLGPRSSRPFRPDFYLSDYGVYVEYWGLADSDPDYDRRHRVKLAAYHKHKIPVISIYPRQLGNLERIFPQLFREITGRDFPA